MDNWFKELGLIFPSETGSPEAEPSDVQWPMVSLSVPAPSVLRGHRSAPFSGKLHTVGRSSRVLPVLSCTFANEAFAAALCLGSQLGLLGCLLTRLLEVEALTFSSWCPWGWAGGLAEEVLSESCRL